MPAGRQPAITVCIPAYRAAAFIGETVSSVLQQTHQDFAVIIAVDPYDGTEDDGTVDALRDFQDDRRVRVVVNESRLGWAENIASLLTLVDTDVFAILPHDDIWHHTYIEQLLPALSSDASASVAYADLVFFGSAGGGKSVVLPQGEPRWRHLLRFFLQGAEAMPWRGLTRRSTLSFTGGFPVDQYRGFAVECEYALSLLAAGPVLHLPEPLYFKRVHPPDVQSASRLRLAGVPDDVRLAAWRNHDARMAGWLERAIREIGMSRHQQDLCRAAFHSASLRRRQGMVSPCLDAPALERIEISRKLVSSGEAEAYGLHGQLDAIRAAHLTGGGSL